MSRNAFLSEALYEAGVCKMADRADGESQMYVLFCYFAQYEY